MEALMDIVNRSRMLLIFEQNGKMSMLSWKIITISVPIEVPISDILTTEIKTKKGG